MPKKNLKFILDSLECACLFFSTDAKLQYHNEKADELFKGKLGIFSGRKNKLISLLNSKGKVLNCKEDIFNSSLKSDGKIVSQVFIKDQKRKKKEAYSMEVRKVFDGSHKLVGFSIFLKHPETSKDPKEIQGELKKLKEENERLQRSSAMKMEFLSNMSHEIRTPLNAIIGMGEVLKEAPLDEEFSSYLNVQIDAGRNLLGLINDILDLSKIESGKLEVESIKVNPLQNLISCVNILKINAEKKGINLSVKGSSDLPQFVLSDPHRLNQIITNLVGNAIKFTPSGKNIRVFVERNPGSLGDSLLFKVEDEGKGIVKDKFDKIFKSFAQEEISTEREYGGTGLGLSISRNLVSLLGGNIWLESELDKGTTFFFTVKVGPVSIDTNKQGKDPTDLETLLIVEDEELNLELYIERLKDAFNVKILTATNGQDALEIIKSQSVDAVLTDFNLPKFSGIDLIQKVRELGMAIPFVLISGYAEEDLSKALKLGSIDFFEKPIADYNFFNKTIERALHKGHELRLEREKDPKDERELKILLAEDTMDNQLLIKTFLRRTPYKIECVENGQEALERITSGEMYDLVLMDISMPIMDGKEAITGIRAWEKENKKSTNVIIALTAYSMEEEIDEIMKAGCDTYLTKPISKMALLNGIKKSTS